MVDFTNVDPRIYGGERPLTPRTDLEGAGQVDAVPPEQTRGENVLNGSALRAQGDAALEWNRRETATIGESIKAGMKSWSWNTVRDYVNAPKFDAEQGHNSAALVKHVPFPLSPEQEKFLLDTNSTAEYEYKLSNLKDERSAQLAMGDHPIASFLTTALDPGYLAIDIASLGAARVVRGVGAAASVQRAVAAGGAFGGAYALGKMEQQENPITEQEVFLNALANGAATGLTYRAGKVVRADPGFPDQELLGSVNRMAGTVAEDGNFVGKADVVPEPGELNARTVDVSGPTGPGTVVGDGGVAGLVPDGAAATPQGPGLSTPRVAATGEGSTSVQYSAGGRNASNPEYNPTLNISRAEQAAFFNDPRVVAVQTTDDIGEFSRNVQLGRTVIDKDAKALYLPDEDKVFLVQGNIKPGDDAKGILLHEYGVHMNAERVLGTKTLGSMLDTLEDMALSGNPRAKAAFADVPKNTPLHLVREEALGYYVERNHGVLNDGIVTKLVVAARKVLRKALPGLKLSEREIMQFVRQSAKGGAKASKSSFDATFPYAWHGSPVRGIDQLDLKYSGSGEGASAFGHGHYVTMEKGTALDYRNKESVRRGINPEEGGLYRVKINANQEDFLNLEGTTQSPHVQAALDALGVPPGLTGKAAYDFLDKSLGGQRAASQALFEQGVAGNRYATGRTRLSEVQNSNYVLFDNSVVSTEARYSKGTQAPLTKREASKVVAEKISVSLHKTFSGFGTKAKEIADFLVDDPLNMTADSVVSQRSAIRYELAHLQYKYEDELAKTLAEQGFGIKNRILSPRKAIAAQAQIEREVSAEMLRRNRLATDGMPVNKGVAQPHIDRMADHLDNVYKTALAEMKRSGVEGADLIAEASGYHSRRWDLAKIETIEGRMVAAGMTPAAAKGQLQDMVSVGIQRANGWDAQVSQDVAKAILDRARSKGYFEDTAFKQASGADELAEVRSILQGLPADRVQRVLDLLVGKADDAGKIPQLKKRVDIAMDESITLPDGTISVADLIDTNMASTTERYLDSVAAQAAFARKGLTKASDIQNLRKDLLESIPSVTERERASKLFDNTIAALQGRPVGEDMNEWMRKLQAATQMVGLAFSGTMQFTEYASAMAKFGGARTLASVVKELPVLRNILSNPKELEHLSNVLARNASEDIRIRPFITRLEDNFEIPVSDSMQLSMMQAKQLTPYLNAMKFIQAHQARTVGNLIADTFTRGAKGDKKALAALEKYGLESHSMIAVQADIAQHGMDTAKWSDRTWDTVRAPLSKMMDDAVLRNRTGEIPAFAQFSQVGKFLFTFRSFVLGAHNKVLAGSLHRDGFSGLGLLMLYQFPMTMAVTAGNNAVAGKKPLTDAELVGTTLSQMGSMGLFSEIIGVTLGTKQQFGSPGTIALDRGYKLLGSIAKGNPGDSAAAAMNSIPLLSVIAPLRAIGEALKDD